MKKENVFEALQDKKSGRELFTIWLCRVAFGSSTFRMLKGSIGSRDLRRFFQKQLGNCSVLAKCATQSAYDHKVEQCIRALRRRSKRIPYGHAAKCVSIYVKAAVVSRGVLSDTQAQKIRRFAHVPIDRFVLQRVWQDFGANIPIQPTAALKSITAREAHRFQAFLRDKACDYGCAPLDYDLAWADRED